MNEEQEYHEQLKRMVDVVRRYGISDARVLNALSKVPRHLFVPENVKENAYDDSPLPIGCGQTISQPYIVALMSELMELKGNERVLEIGTGSGYQAAVLSLLAAEVYSVEFIDVLFYQAVERLKNLGYSNVRVRCGDGYEGWKEFAPYDAVMVTCGAPRLPQPLVEQTKVGGRIVIPLGDYHETLQLIRFIKRPDTSLEREYHGGVLFVPMRGKVEEKTED
ncbi:MAG: protein-L-isoaspartate(D-aspartate) O-methyltransferase [Planctomycetota bacterium]|nr:protein-L-isoaspartate(D-aspartate) O-methyltransferase [Planctomycetota bacterium]